MPVLDRYRLGGVIGMSITMATRLCGSSCQHHIEWPGIPFRALATEPVIYRVLDLPIARGNTVPS